MAQIGTIDHVLQDTAGNTQPGVNFEVRKQGAKILGGGSGDTGVTPITISVNNPGGIVVGDTVIQVAGGVVGTAPFGVSAVTATSITVNTGGAMTWSDDDRLSPTTNLPTLYKEPNIGADTQTNPIVTGADGRAQCWAAGGFYDLYLSGGTTPITPKVIEDEFVPAEYAVSNIFTGAGAVGYVWDTARDLTTAGAKLASFRRLGVEKFYVDKDGGTGALTVNGTLTVASGGIAVTGNSTIAGTLGGLTGLTVASGGASVTGGLTIPTGGATITAGGLTVTAGSVSLPTGSIQTAALPANLVVAAPVLVTGGTANVTLTDPPAETVRVTTTYGASTGNAGVLVNVSLPYEVDVNQSTGQGHIKVRLYINGVLRATGICENHGDSGAGAATVSVGHTVAFSWFEANAPTSAATVYEVRDIVVDDVGTTTIGKYRGDLTNDGGSKAYMQLIEFKR